MTTTQTVAAASPQAQEQNTRFAKVFYTVEELTELLSVSFASVYDWVRRGQLAAYRFGRTIRVASADLDAFLQRMHSRQAASEPAYASRTQG